METEAALPDASLTDHLSELFETREGAHLPLRRDQAQGRSHAGGSLGDRAFRLGHQHRTATGRTPESSGMNFCQNVMISRGS